MRQAMHFTPSLSDRRLRWRRERLPWLRRRLAEPSAAFFTRIRLRLIAWYMGVLVAILLAAGLLLYFGMQTTVLNPVNTALEMSATQIGASWRTSGVVPCDYQSGSIAITNNAEGVLPSYVTCFDQDGRSLGIGSGPSTTQVGESQFVHPDLVQTALVNGSATDTVDGGPTIGAIQRYALTVRDARGAVLGIVQVGYPVQEYENSLHTLAVLLLLVGMLTIAGAGLGGWFLAARALEPARVAVGRQRAFVADAAHELRTPLTVLRADAEALLFHRSQLPPDDAELLDNIVAETGHMTQLAGNLLTLARLDAGVTHVETDIVELRALLARVAQRVRALALQQQITLETAATESVHVVGDPLLLEQAAMILLDNAIKYNRPGGKVTLLARRRDQWAEIEVRDTGIGIAASNLTHVGERFYRVDAAHARETGGAGLGVSIARGIAAAHHGVLTYASMPRQGTTATLILPGVIARAQVHHTASDIHAEASRR